MDETQVRERVTRWIEEGRDLFALLPELLGAEKEAEILALKVPEADVELRNQVARFVQRLRKLELKKAPSIAETLDWCRALLALGVTGLDAAAVRQTLNLLLKHEEDIRRAEPKVPSLLG